MTKNNKVMKESIPEKLYIIQHNELICYCRNNDENIDHTCIDAFIEKACSWLKENCKNYIIVDIDKKYEGLDGLFFEDFKKYMKGE